MPDFDRRLFFFHNPKAGGSSVNRALGSMFPPAEHCPLIENTERDHQHRAGNYREFRGYRYYAGHYGHDIFQAVADRHDPVGNFREPGARLLSLYNFYRIQPPLPDDAEGRDDLYPVAFAKQVDFHRFVSTDDPRIEIHTRNHQVRQLTGSAWEPGSPGSLVQATAMLDRMPWFFVCEHPQHSQRWGEQVFGNGFPPIPRENVTRADAPGGDGSDPVAAPSIAPATRRVIRDKNALDAALHARAVRRLLQQAPGPVRRWPWSRSWPRFWPRFWPRRGPEDA